MQRTRFGVFDVALVAAAIAVLVASLTLPLIRPYPRRALILYLGLVLFVPYWIGIVVAGQFIPLAFLLAIWSVVAVFRVGVRYALVDLLLLALVALVLLGVVTGQVRFGHALALMGSWIAPYLLGRHTEYSVGLARITPVIAVITAILSVQALTEFILNWHPFTSLDFGMGPAEIWNSIQYRSQFPRSEGALGHSITMGGVIAIGVPFILMTRWRIQVRVLLLAIATCAVAVTFSRNALIAVGLAILFTSMLSSRAVMSTIARRGLVFAVVLAGGIGAPVYLRIIDGGTGVLAASTDYRANYLSLLPSIQWFGLAPIFTEYAPGQFGWASDLYAGDVIVTLDNSVLLTALQFGWIPTAPMLAAFGCIALAMFRTRDNPALVATCAQFFTVATVAMITQFPYMFWLVLGLGASSYQRSKLSTAEEGGQNAIGMHDGSTLDKGVGANSSRGVR